MAKVLERSLYQTDYYAWTKDQAAKLRALAAARVTSPLDLENLAEEVESLGRSDLNTVRSQVRRIVEHLLKLEFSQVREARAEWVDGIDRARDEVEDHITGSMRLDAAADLAKLFGRARRDAVTGLRRHGEREAAQALPTTCPNSLEQIVSHDWHPQNRHGVVDDLDSDASAWRRLGAAPVRRRRCGPRVALRARRRDCASPPPKGAFWSRPTQLLGRWSRSAGKGTPARPDCRTCPRQGPSNSPALYPGDRFPYPVGP
jgi:hypothetical protein